MNKWLVIGFFALYWCSCSNELDVNTIQPYVPVVYCLLDLNAQDQYVRVSRSYEPDEGDQFEFQRVQWHLTYVVRD